MVRAKAEGPWTSFKCTLFVQVRSGSGSFELGGDLLQEINCVAGFLLIACVTRDNVEMIRHA